MSTLTEIEAAAKELPDDEKRALLRFLVESLPHGLPTAEPRTFTVEQMQAWADEDVREYAELKAKWASEQQLTLSNARP